MLETRPVQISKSPLEEVVEILAERLLWLTLRGLGTDSRRAAERNIVPRVVIGEAPINDSEFRERTDITEPPRLDGVLNSGDVLVDQW